MENPQNFSLPETPSEPTIENLAAMNSEAQKIFEEKQQQIDNYNKTIEEAQKILATLQDEVNAKEAEYQALVSQNEMNNDVEIELEKELDELESQHKSEMNEMIAKHEDEMNQLRSQAQQFLEQSELPSKVK